MVTALTYVTEDIDCQLQPPTDYEPETVDLASYKVNDLHDSTEAVASRALIIFRTCSVSQAAQWSKI